MGSDLIPAAEMKNIFPGTTDQYWATLRHKGTGPPFVKVVRKVYYSRAAVASWVDAHTLQRTGDPLGAA